MLDDFFIRALLAGVGVAIIAGPFGCFIVWRRLSYFGDTLAHSALLGVALAFAFQANMTFSVFTVAAVVSLFLVLMQRQKLIASDALLGIFSHAALALGLIALALMTWVRVDLMGFLFGDILAVTKTDLATIFVLGVVLLSLLTAIWRPLFAITVDADLAKGEGIRVEFYNLTFMLLMAFVIALCMKLVGVLLITALLIIPAATVRSFASGPEGMAVMSVMAGSAAVVAGLFSSLQWDTPAGPSVVAAAFAGFILTSIVSMLIGRYSQWKT